MQCDAMSQKSQNPLNFRVFQRERWVTRCALLKLEMTKNRLRDVGVAGSNPVTPTNESRLFDVRDYCRGSPS